MLHSERRKVWEARVADYRQSRMSVREWCAKHEVTRDQLKYWVKRTQEKTACTQWTPVQIAPEPVPAVGGITIRLGAARIEVAPGFDRALLEEVLSVVAAAC
jgi:hypothetical protein